MEDEKPYPQYMGEIARIVEGATRGDMAKVKAYVGLLVEKLEADGHASTAAHIKRIADGDAGAAIVPREVSRLVKACNVCRGARHMQHSITREIRVCWKCNAGGTVDKSLRPGKRWA